MSLNKAEKNQLLAIARDSIQHGIDSNEPLIVNLQDYSAALNEKGASFVTLELNHQLRGCIGMLDAIRPLAQDVAENAFAAAFRDRRFAPVNGQEVNQLAVHISILTPATPIQFSSEIDLLKQLRPQVDGLILVEGARRATFLPSVWDSLPEPTEFLYQLKRKAGLPSNYWSESLQFFRYHTEMID